MTTTKDHGMWLLRVASACDDLPLHHQEALRLGCDDVDGPTLAKAYGKLRSKLVKRWGTAPESLSQYVRALRRLIDK